MGLLDGEMVIVIILATLISGCFMLVLVDPTLEKTSEYLPSEIGNLLSYGRICNSTISMPPIIVAIAFLVFVFSTMLIMYFLWSEE